MREGAMPLGGRELENLVLTAFKRALADQRPDVAEHLLVALELLGRGSVDEGQDAELEPQLTEAYRMIAKLAKPQR